MKIWHQSFTVLEELPAYQQAIEKHIKKVVRPGTQVEVHGLKPGTYPTNYPGTDIAYSSLYTMHALQWFTQAIKSQDQSFDAFAMCTLPNPFIREIRTLVDIPVVGYGEASFHTACMLGQRFGVLIFIDRMVPLYKEQVGIYGLESRCTGIEPVGFTFHDVLKAWNDPGELIERFEKSAMKLVEQGADVIIPGEMPMNILLATHGINRVKDVPILDGMAVTLKMAETFVDLKQSIGLSQSRHGWMNAKPPRERVDQVMEFYGLNR
ncbi:MAG: aspartate/glutamate racemase family protein [Betaproteobacteria bacterium]